MAKSNRGPALYELISDRGRVERSRPTLHTRTAKPRETPPAPRVEAAPPAPPAEESEGSSIPVLFKPGTSIRLPVGYIWFGAVGILVIGIAGYSIGFQQANTRHDQAREQAQQAELASIQDPTLRRQPEPETPSTGTPAPITANRPVSVGAATNEQPGSSVNEPAGTARARAVKMDTGDPDPRISGMNYIVLAHWRVPDADSAVDFLASHGVAAARLSPNNRGLANVIALEGFEPGEIRSDRYKSLKDEIKRLGRLYVREENGPGDFGDLYPQKFQG